MYKRKKTINCRSTKASQTRKLWRAWHSKLPTCLLPYISIIFYGHMPSLFKFKRRINCQFLAIGFSVCFSPSGLSWILLSFECFVTFTSTESEYLKQKIISQLVLWNLCILYIMISIIHLADLWSLAQTHYAYFVYQKENTNTKLLADFNH